MKSTGVARFVYTVHGTADAIAEYIENQGDNARFLQEDNTISPDETLTPVFYSTRIVGKNPTIVWDSENDRYQAQVSFEDAVIMDAARSAYSSNNDSVTDRNDVEESDDDTKGKITPNPKATDKPAARRVTKKKS